MPQQVNERVATLAQLKLKRSVISAQQDLNHKQRVARGGSSGSGSIKMKVASSTRAWIALSVIILAAVFLVIVNELEAAMTNEQPAMAGAFPGVAHDLQSFCAARPSLPVDLATMIVHVKRNNSFNYKLYLFAGDDYVIQTGQIVPRDDFRVHSFPVRVRKLDEFWPANVPVITEAGAPGIVSPQENFAAGGQRNENNSRQLGNKFDLHRFFALVPLLSDDDELVGREASERRARHRARRPRRRPRFDVHDLEEGEPLPGESVPHDVALVPDKNEQQQPQQHPNEHIKFDRDDEVALLGARRPSAQNLNNARVQHERHQRSSEQPALVMPVGAFSSFHVNTTYLVRKDFGQTNGQLIRIVVDAHAFQVTEVRVFDQNDEENGPGDNRETSFLKHKLLRDKNTRINSINQIYEDWITRNFYTVVYVQRKLDVTHTAEHKKHEIVTERLVFRGSSAVLLGADQLDYFVKASAFITEKNGLHYYLEFLATKHKFYLGAIDWSKRPFRVIDAQRFPMKHTNTLYDNEELLLCPPAACYSEQPIDELVAYGRLELSDQLQRQAAHLTSTSLQQAGKPRATLEEDEEDYALLHLDEGRTHKQASETNWIEIGHSLLAALRSGWRSLQIKLHLRDWTWLLERSVGHAADRAQRDSSSASSTFAWRFTQAKRNELKPNRDTYGFALTGHEIDASYRIFNELHLISANQLITINYTLINETVVSSHPIGEDFEGLESTLLDPITAAFYDRNSNQLYFFKGDRYVGYDYATKKPLEDFRLPAPHATAATSRLVGQQQQQPMANAARMLVSTMPVAGILGRQNHVDAIYHDQFDDRVYVFTGMKFYSFRASEFKDGTFHAPSKNPGDLPPMFCINEHFLIGCRFDRAYPNPCQSDQRQQARTKSNDLKTPVRGSNNLIDEKEHREMESTRASKFRDDQQNRLRAIATSGRQGRLLDFLLENKLVDQMLLGSQESNETALLTSMLAASEHNLTTSSQERVVVYLLVAMVATTILITIAMILIIVRWASAASATGDARHDGDEDRNGSMSHTKKGEEEANIQRSTQLPPRLQQMLNDQQRNRHQAPVHYAVRVANNQSPAHRQNHRQYGARQQYQASSQFSVSQMESSARTSQLSRQRMPLPEPPRFNDRQQRIDSSAL